MTKNSVISNMIIGIKRRIITVTDIPKRFSYTDMDVASPRDRNGEYELQFIKKYRNTLT